MEELISMNALLRSKKIHWVKSLAALKRWVDKDMESANILQTIRITHKGVTRYYFRKNKVDEFVRAFNAGELFKG